MTTRGIKIALLLNALLIGLGLYAFACGSTLERGTDLLRTVVAPIGLGICNGLALMSGRRHAGMHALAHLWALAAVFYVPIVVLAAEAELRPWLTLSAEWENSQPHEYACFALIIGATLAALFALRVQRVFRPPLLLTLIVVPLLATQRLIVVSDAFQLFVEELIYGPVPDGIEAWTWYASHDAPREHADGWFLLIWIGFFVAGAYRGIPQHSELIAVTPEA